MKVSLIGAGNMGSACVQQWVRVGHQVSVTAGRLSVDRAITGAR
jgi:predicted dinucleotide-binding enzyme